MSSPQNSGPVVCPLCSARSAAMPEGRRCASCGALMEGPRGARGSGASARRSAFSPFWCLISLVVQAVLTAALVVGLPLVVHQLDFEGSHGMTVSIPVWLLGGTLIGMIVPGKMVLEPVVGSAIVAVPTVYYLIQSQTVRTMPMFMYVIMGLIGVMFALVGIYIGERIQMGPAPRPAR